MDLRPLGATSLLVSPIGLGTVKLGRNRAVKYPGGDGFPLPDDARVDALFTAAADLGVNLIDTAPAYGHSEQRIGEAMRRGSWFGGRDRWILCTKAGEEFNNDTGESRFDFSPEAVRASVQRSMRRLHTDHLDLVLLHSDGRDEWIIEHSGALEVLRELTRMGVIRAFGVSAKTVDGGLLAVRRADPRRVDDPAGSACGVIMVTYNPRERDAAIVIDAAAYRSIGVLVKKAFGSGHIAESAARVPVDLRNPAASPADSLIRFALARPGVSSAVIGTTDPAHLKAAVDASRSANPPQDAAGL